MNGPFSGFNAPEPPAELREATLAAATSRWSHTAPPDGWRRIWESKPLRLVWTATVVVLVAWNAALPRKVAPSRDVTAESNEVRDVVKLPRLRAGYVAAAPEPKSKKEERS